MQQSLLPQNNDSLMDIGVDDLAMPTRTFHIDFTSQKVVGLIDQVQAMEQSIFLAFKTKRFNHLIFSWDYGEEINNLIGKPKDLAKAELPRLIKECLLVDDRISDIENITFEDIEDGLRVRFIARTIHGDVEIEREVML